MFKLWVRGCASQLINNNVSPELSQVVASANESIHDMNNMHSMNSRNMNFIIPENKHSTPIMNNQNLQNFQPHMPFPVL